MTAEILVAMPSETVDRIVAQARCRNADANDYLIEQLVAGLPRALERAAAETIQPTRSKTPNTPTPPAGTDGVVHLNELTTQAAQIVPPGDLIDEDTFGGRRPV